MEDITPRSRTQLTMQAILMKRQRIGGQSLGETVTRPIARIKIKSAIIVRETGRGQSGRGADGPRLVVA